MARTRPNESRAEAGPGLSGIQCVIVNGSASLPTERSLSAPGAAAAADADLDRHHRDHTLPASLLDSRTLSCTPILRDRDRSPIDGSSKVARFLPLLRRLVLDRLLRSRIDLFSGQQHYRPHASSPASLTASANAAALSLLGKSATAKAS
jgi:hypothetical protein